MQGRKGTLLKKRKKWQKPGKIRRFFVRNGDVFFLPQRYVQRHHQAEACGEEDRAQVGVGALGHFRDQLFHHNVEHGSCGEAQKAGEGGDDEPGRKNGQDGADRLHDAGEDAVPERLSLTYTFRAQGHGDDGAFGEVLDGDAKGKRQRPGSGDLGAAGEKAGVYDAHGHAFGDVMKGHRQHHHGGVLELASGAFHLPAFLVQMGDHMVQDQQEEDTDPESGGCREKRPAPQIGGLFDGRNQQAPDGGRHHDAGGKAGQRPADTVDQSPFHKKDAGCSQRSAEKRNEDAVKCFHNAPFCP